MTLIQTFFVCFFLLVGVVLMNIVVAVLLDEFLTTVSFEKVFSPHRQAGCNLGEDWV